MDSRGRQKYLSDMRTKLRRPSIKAVSPDDAATLRPSAAIAPQSRASADEQDVLDYEKALLVARQLEDEELGSDEEEDAKYEWLLYDEDAEVLEDPDADVSDEEESDNETLVCTEDELGDDLEHEQLRKEELQAEADIMEDLPANAGAQARQVLKTQRFIHRVDPSHPRALLFLYYGHPYISCRSQRY